MNWLISIFTPSPKMVDIDTRVRTPFGPGTVTGGSVNVALDEGYKPPNHGAIRPGKRAHVTVSLEKVSL